MRPRTPSRCSVAWRSEYTGHSNTHTYTRLLTHTYRHFTHAYTRLHTYTHAILSSATAECRSSLTGGISAGYGGTEWEKSERFVKQMKTAFIKPTALCIPAPAPYEAFLRQSKSNSASAPVMCTWYALRVSASQLLLVNALDVSGICTRDANRGRNDHKNKTQNKKNTEPYNHGIIAGCIAALASLSSSLQQVLLDSSVLQQRQVYCRLVLPFLEQVLLQAVWSGLPKHALFTFFLAGGWTMRHVTSWT